jgi:hypothetical protein
MLRSHSALRRIQWAGGALLLAMASCSGGSNGTSMGSMSSSPPTPMLTADFDSIQTNVFTPICAGCHSGPDPAANLSLDAAHSYNDLVNVPSTEQPMLDRVKPGDPTDSFLIIHLRNDGDGAPASDIPFIVQWIMDGAPPGSSMAMSSEFKIAVVEPDSGGTLHAPPPRIVIGFSQELDTSGLNPAAVRLERVNEDAATQGATLAIPATVSVPAHNARALLVTPDSALAPGQYQVVLSLDSGVVLRAQSGAVLDAAGSVSGERVVTRFSVAAN